jgi:transcriptional regulator with XRE-family HTH domain
VGLLEGHRRTGRGTRLVWRAAESERVGQQHLIVVSLSEAGEETDAEAATTPIDCTLTSEVTIANTNRAMTLRRCDIVFYPFVWFCHFLVEADGMPGQESLGERVRNLRLRKQLSQAQLAWPELSDSYVSLIESGKRSPAPSMVALLARKLGCSESYLLTGVTEETISGLRETLEYAQIALQNGAAAEARIRFSEVLTDPALADLPALAHEARWGHALALEATGALEEAISDLELATEMLSPLSEPERWAEVHTALSRCHRERGDLARSIQVGEDALDRLTAAGGPWTDTMVMLGSTILAGYEQRGDLAYARQLAEILIERAEAIGSPRALMAAYWNAAWVADLRSETREALRLSERAIALLGEEDDPRNLPRLRAVYAHFLLRVHPDQAERALELMHQAEREMDASSASTVDFAHWRGGRPTFSARPPEWPSPRPTPSWATRRCASGSARKGSPRSPRRWSTWRRWRRTGRPPARGSTWRNSSGPRGRPTGRRPPSSGLWPAWGSEPKFAGTDPPRRASTLSFMEGFVRKSWIKPEVQPSEE